MNSFIKKLRNFYLRHKENILIITFLLICVSAFLIGFFTTTQILIEPINQEEITTFKETANNIYSDGIKYLYKDNSSMNISITSQHIYVKSSDLLKEGQIIATPINNTLVFEYDNQYELTFCKGWIGGMIMLLIIWFVIGLLEAIFNLILKLNKTTK